MIDRAGQTWILNREVVTFVGRGTQEGDGYVVHAALFHDDGAVWFTLEPGYGYEIEQGCRRLA